MKDKTGKEYSRRIKNYCWKLDTSHKHPGSFTRLICWRNACVKEIRTKRPRWQNKKTANHEWVWMVGPYTRLCGTTLSVKEGWRERPYIQTGLCQSSKDIARMLSPIKQGRAVKSSQVGRE